jgi:hypothetical protein
MKPFKVPRETWLCEAGRKDCDFGGSLACLRESSEISERFFSFNEKIGWSRPSVRTI